MKKLSTLALMLSLLPAMAAEKLEVLVHYVEIPAAMQPTVDLSLLSRMEKADVIKIDPVRIEPGQTAKISSGKDFPVPDRDPVFTGVTVHLTPTMEGNEIRYTLDAEETRFAGYANLRSAFATPEAPAFTSRRVFGLKGTAQPAVAHMLELRPSSDPLSDSRTRVFLIIKFTQVSDE